MKRKRCTKQKPMTAEEMRREVERLVGSDSFDVLCWGNSISAHLAIEHEGECADLLMIRADGGSVARQLHAELQRVIGIYNQLLAKATARVWQDEIDAEIAAERRAAS